MFDSKTKTKDKFITEEFTTEIAKVESADDGSVYIEGVFLKGDIISLNDRFYSESIVKNFVEQINSNKNIITMWTNHYPTDETLATVAKVVEARYDSETKLAWFKAKMAKTSAAKDITSLLEDKILEGVSIRYWPSKVKEAKIKDALYVSILEAEFLGIDFVATRTGVPVAKVKSISREELESFELAFNNKEELDMSDLEKKLTESSDNIDTKEDEKVEDVKEDEKVEDVKEDEKVEEKVEEKAEEKVEEKVETEETADIAKEDQEKEEEKVDKKVEESEEQKPEEVNEWKIKYEALVSNINSYLGKFIEGLKTEALNTFDSIKDKKIYSKISLDIESIKFDFNEDITVVIDKYNESINSTVEAYKELLDELNTKVAISDAKEAILQKGEVVEGKKLEVGKGISKEAVDLFTDYGIVITEEDAKLMESN